jgi:hypothetical protein
MKDKERKKNMKVEKDDYWAAMKSIDNCKHMESFLFFMDNDFHLVSFYSCHQGYTNHIDFKETLLKSFYESKKLHYDVRRGYELDKEMKDHRLRGANLNLEVDEILYKYSNAAARPYCMCRTKDFSEFDNELIQANLKETIEYFEKNGYRHYIEQAKDLASINTFYVDTVEHFKTIDHVIKSINKQIKSKQL